MNLEAFFAAVSVFAAGICIMCAVLVKKMADEVIEENNRRLRLQITRTLEGRKAPRR